MSRKEPDATSTPTSVPHITGRPGIRDNVSVQSPINMEQTKPQYETRSYTRSQESYNTDIRKSPSQSPRKSPRSFPNEADRRSGSYDSESDPDHYSDGEGLSSDGDHFELDSAKPDSQDKSQLPIYIGGAILALIAAALASLYFLGEAPSQLNHDEFKILENEFKKQDVDFWRNIKISILEIPVLEQPRTIMFLYDNKAERTLDKILRKVSQLALSHLNPDSHSKGVEIAGASLNTSEVVSDYGKIISRYRSELEERGLMIVRNLEKVPGASAQAFHSFCDDYNPVVKKALILFTLKVEKLPEGYPMKFVENFLLKLWYDLGKEDKFYPLFTRISSTILPVRPE